MPPDRRHSSTTKDMMQTQENTRRVVERAFYGIFCAMARIAIRYGVSAGVMGELVRRAFVEAAERELTSKGIKPFGSRVCALTGLYRKEVVRIKALPPVGDLASDDRYNRSARVVTGWTQDRDFCTKRGQPATLSIDGPLSFATLVKRYSGDMTPRSILEELKRLQVVSVTSKNRIKLLSRAYVPATSELDTLQILGTDVPDLIETIQYNLKAAPDNKRFQRKVSYLHIPERHVPTFMEYAASESQSLLEKLDRWLAQRDTEHKSLGTPGSRLGLGIYVIESTNEQPAEPSINLDHENVNDQ